jgi:acetyl-CoA C-acetyltransferase
VGANGGYLSKHSVGVYSTQPCEWRPNANEQLQAGLDQIQSVVVETDPSGVFELESYTILYKGEHPQLAIIIARSPETDKRAVATSVDQLTILALSSAPPKTNVTLHAGQPINTFELRGE